MQAKKTRLALNGDEDVSIKRFCVSSEDKENNDSSQSSRFISWYTFIFKLIHNCPNSKVVSLGKHNKKFHGWHGEIYCNGQITMNFFILQIFF